MSAFHEHADTVRGWLKHEWTLDGRRPGHTALDAMVDQFDRLNYEYLAIADRGDFLVYRNEWEARNDTLRRLEEEMAVMREELRLRESSQIPVVPEGAQGRLERLEANERMNLDALATAGNRIADLDAERAQHAVLRLLAIQALGGFGKTRQIADLTDEHVSDVDADHPERPDVATTGRALARFLVGEA